MTNPPSPLRIVDALGEMVSELHAIRFWGATSFA